MIILFGADHAGTPLKEELKRMLIKKYPDMRIEDISPTEPEKHDDYPDYAFSVGARVGKSPAMKGVLICDTGIGMSIAANKVPGVYAALVHNSFEATRAREHNNANIIVFGKESIRAKDAFEALIEFIYTPFSGSERHERRTKKIQHYDQHKTES